jgi:tripartite-type tricarboxylate transporter receptor subunit TctC
MKCLAKFLVAAAFASSLVLPSLSVAQTYPTKPIKLIVPMPAGGISDIVARAAAESMRKDLGQMIVVENKPGAVGRIGIEAVRQSPADGYTLLLAISNTHVLAPVLRKDLPYDPEADFAPIGLICFSPLALVIRADLPITTVQELIDYAKKNPGKLTFASTGPGSGSHLPGEMLKYFAGIDILHVAYKGTAPALNDLLAGHVDMTFGGTDALPHVQDGKLRVLTTTGTDRWFVYPDAPTTTEAGLPKIRSAPWWGLEAPKGTPQPIIERLNRSLNVALKDANVRSTLNSQGYDVVKETSPAEMDSYIASEIKRWSETLTQINFKLQ